MLIFDLDMFTILEKDMLTPTICRMVVSAPRIASSAKPGQFLIVRNDEKGERVPLTISDYDPEKGTVTIVTQKIGVSSAEIIAREPGEAFADVVGPLGKASDLCELPDEELRKLSIVFIAGGVGTAPVYPQAKWLKEHGAHVEVIIGARNEGLLIYTKEMAQVCDELHLCTDDGSLGFKGVGTAMLEKLVAEGKRFDRCIAIGPMIMMKFSTLTCIKLGIPVVVSLNTLMVDGTGMCGACRVSVGGKTKFACVDGPEFDGALVDFDEAMRRQGQYRTEEAEANEKHVCKIGRGK